MSTHTNIEWCDSTFNPWIGCTRVSPACDDCYAARSTPARTLGVAWGPHERRRRTSPENWLLPLRWESQATEFLKQHSRRRRVFCASLADVFDNQVPVEWRHDFFELIRLTPSLDWLLLTKRPQNIVRMVMDHGAVGGNGTRFLPSNVWLGTTAEDQQRADLNIPALLNAKSYLRQPVAFVSVEPMLSPIDLTKIETHRGEVNPSTWAGPRYGFWDRLEGDRTTFNSLQAADGRPGLDWVICGGESGPRARPMHPDWARCLRDQCASAGVPFLFKQWGEWHPACGDVSRDRLAVSKHSGDAFRIKAIERARHFDLLDRCQMHRVGKKAAGRLLDGLEYNSFPRGEA